MKTVKNPGVRPQSNSCHPGPKRRTYALCLERSRNTMPVTMLLPGILTKTFAPLAPDGLQRTKQRTTTPPASTHNPNSCHPGAKRRTYALCLRHQVHRVHPVHCRRPAGGRFAAVLTVLKRFCSWVGLANCQLLIANCCSPGAPKTFAPSARAVYSGLSNEQRLRRHPTTTPMPVVLELVEEA